MFLIDDIVGAAVKAVDGLTGGLAGKALDLATKNPLVDLFESAAKQLGVPDEIVNIGELAAGICTGNFALAAHAGKNLLSDLAENGRARTEYASCRHACGGYSEDKPRRSDESEYREALTTLNKKFDEFDAFKCIFGGDGLVTQDELRHLVNSSNTPPDVKKAAEYFLERPEKFNKLEVSAGIGGKDGLVGKLDVNAELAKVNERSEGSPRTDRDPHCSETSDQSEYQQALTTLNKRFDEFDAFKSIFGGDGLVTQDELRHLANNSNIPPDVKKAAEYFLAHPENFNKLEVSAGIGGKDGLAGKLDVNAELAKVNEQIASERGNGSTEESTGSSSFPNAQEGIYSPTSFQGDDEQAREVRKLLASRGMPMEAKIMLFATAMASKLDKAIDAQMQKVDGLAQKQTAGYAEGASKQQKDEAQGSSGSLQIEMQKLNLIMGLEKTLLEVASNAIQNYNQINGKIAGNTRV